MENKLVKVVYQDGERIRILKGSIAREDDFFLVLDTYEGEQRLAKSIILKVKPVSTNGAGSHD